MCLNGTPWGRLLDANASVRAKQGRLSVQSSELQREPLLFNIRRLATSGAPNAESSSGSCRAPDTAPRQACLEHLRFSPFCCNRKESDSSCVGNQHAGRNVSFVTFSLFKHFPRRWNAKFSTINHLSSHIKSGQCLGNKCLHSHEQSETAMKSCKQRQATESLHDVNK